MKILFVHNYYKIRGGEDQSFELDVKLLRSMGYEVITYIKKNSEIDEYSIFKKLLFPINTIYSLSTYYRIKKIVKKEKPNLAIVQNVFPLISPSVYDALHKSKIIMLQSVRNFRFFCINSSFYDGHQICEICPNEGMKKSVYKKCYKNSLMLSLIYFASIWTMRKKGIVEKISKFIVLNDFVANKMEMYGVPKNKLTVKSNFVSSLPKKQEQASAPYILYIGSLLKHKGVSTLIKAFVKAKSQNIDLVIAGEGPEENELKRDIPIEFRKRIQFVGYMKGEEKEKLLSLCMFLVFPSEWYENFPRTILEAFSHKKPVITTNLGWLPSLVRNSKGGLIYNNGDVHGLVGCINYLNAHPVEASKMGEYNFDLCQKFYSEEIVKDQFLKIIGRNNY